MTDHKTPGTKRTETGSPSPDRGARAAAVAAALLAVTVAGGVAARITATDTGPGPLTFGSQTTGPVHLSGQLDRGSVLAGGDGTVKLELVIRGGDRRSATASRVPTDLVVVLDRSGSMQGGPLVNALAATRDLVGRLHPDDRFALVSYADQASLDVALAEARPEATARWLTRLDQTAAGGGTNMAAGLDLATGLLGGGTDGRAVRVVLLSDGHANQGDATLDGLRGRVLGAARQEAVLSAVGVGDGFDEALMTALADAGTGNFYYVAHAEDLGDVFAGEFASARETVASALAVSLRTPDGVEVVDAAGYPLERQAGAVVFRPGSLFAGQERRVWITLRAPTQSAGELDLGRVSVAYRAEGVRREVALDRALAVACVQEEDEFFASVDPDAWGAAAADEYSNLKQRLSTSIQQGRAKEASSLISAYRDEKRELNERIKSKDVAAQLEDLVELEASVEEAFAAPAPARSRASKQLAAEGYDGRRVGAKK